MKTMDFYKTNIHLSLLNTRIYVDLCKNLVDREDWGKRDFSNNLKLILISLVFSEKMITLGASV